MSAYYDQVIEAAYLHSRPNCYFVGPYARRVSFASQQHRALDLVTALEHDGRLRGKRIAVIGAGVAGVTVTAALRGLDYGLDLYEAQSDPLTVQKQATHRIVHPSISRWPAEDLEFTTRFRVLDWPMGPCSSIIAALRQQWDDYVRPGPSDTDFRFFSGRTISKILCFDGKVSFSTEPASVTAAYDIVIVTTGFGRELEVEGVPYVSYWSRDKVDEWRRERKRVVVSGCGDGGLIDALRLVHGHFDDGRLALKLAFILDGQGPEFKNRINKVEADALLAAKSIKCIKVDAPGAKSDRQIGKAFEDAEVVGPMSEFYKRLSDELPPQAETLLRESYEAGSLPGQVELVSMQSQPFGPYAAPIHKLMVAHAMKRFFITYKCAKVASGPAKGRGGRSIVGDFIIKVASGPVKRKGGVSNAGDVIIRHGAHSNLETLLEHEERESLKIRQFLLADYIDKDKSDFERLAPKNVPTDPGSIEYIRAKYEMANSLVGWLKPGLTLSAREDGYHLDGGTLVDCRMGVPTSLFDVPVRLGEPPMYKFF